MSVLRAESGFRATPAGALADVSDGYLLYVDLLEPWLCRVALVPRTGLGQPSSWMIAPDGAMPWAGRPRLSVAGFTCPLRAIERGGRALTSATLRVRLANVVGESLALVVERRDGERWRAVTADRPLAAYRRMAGRDELHHAQSRAPDARHYGLGDKSGPLDRTGRRFRCLQVDATGYDAERSDPLYKHVPWLIAADANGCCGLLYDTLAEVSFDVGAERSGRHAPYRTVELREDVLVCYVVDGPALVDVLRRLSRLVGGYCFPPRRALGFGFGAADHADVTDAQRTIERFVTDCERHDVPLSVLHLGSGYTAVAEGREDAFVWNALRFPDPGGFVRMLGERGIGCCASVGPVLSIEHPDFDTLAAVGAFVRHADGTPVIEPLRQGACATLDFTRAVAREWWRSRLDERLLALDVDGCCNDDNECELRDEDAFFEHEGEPIRALDARPVQALLMTRASEAALLARRPGERPHLVSRAGPLGIARHAQSWSGGNRSSWHTLRWNLVNGLSMSLSGLPHVGHDIGGFDGPSPDAELLVRWVEMMALHPRAVMSSSGRDGGVATTPWLHPEALDAVRALLELRCRLLPLIYHLAWEAHVDGLPPLRPLSLVFGESRWRGEAGVFMLGEDLLVAPVVESGARERRVELPAVAGGWYHWDGTLEGAAVPLRGVRETSVAAPPGRLPLFVRDGAVLPLASEWPADAPHDAVRVTLRPFVGAGSQGRARLMLDDGRSTRWREREASLLAIRCTASDEAVRLEARERWSGRGRPALAATLGADDRRRLVASLPSPANGGG